MTYRVEYEINQIILKANQAVSCAYKRLNELVSPIILFNTIDLRTAGAVQGNKILGRKELPRYKPITILGS